LNYDRFIDPVVQKTPISGIRRVNFWESKISNDKQIRLNIGQPDLPTPSYIKGAVVEALDNNFTRYTDLMGEYKLRQSVSEYLKSFFNLSYSPDEILITSGGQSAIFASLQTILSPNDNIIIPFPSYPPYINAINYNGANIIPLFTKVENGFDLDINDLQELLEKQPVKALLLISPSNPTGTVIPRKTMDSIVRLACDYDFLIISDEIYSNIIFDDLNYTSIATIPEAKERTIIIHSFSKMLSMCGFRIGFITAPSPLIDNIKVIHHTMNICANSLAQYAALKALTRQELMKKAINEIVQTYQNRRDLCLRALGQNENFEVSKPHGAFYLFPKLEGVDMLIFCKWLKKEYGVLTVPGIYFSQSDQENHQDYFRICFTADLLQLEEGLNKIIKAVNRYKM
jgi:aspartate/methionine/tyrosine aminotransferase